MKNDSTALHPQLRILWVLLTCASVVGFPILAADLVNFGVLKIRQHEQSGPLPGNPPAASDFIGYAFGLQPEPETLAVGILTAPGGGGGGIPAVLVESSTDRQFLESQESFSSLNLLNAGFPAGTYEFSFISMQGSQLEGSIVLGADAYPNAPALSNFDAAQSISPSEAFTLQWTGDAILNASDYVVVTIEADGEPIFETPRPGIPGALAGTETSVVIPANSLPTDAVLSANILLINITSTDANAIPGAQGLTGYGASTRTPLKLGSGGGGGGGDTGKPKVISSQPGLGSFNVPSTSPLILQFNEPMKPQQSIQWIGVPNPAAFTYTWSANGQTLTCSYPGGFPASASIVWQLDVRGFQDLAGNLLQDQNIAGAFTVAAGGGGGGGGGGVPCGTGVLDRQDGFFLARLAHFSQTTAGTPESENSVDNPAAAFFAGFSAAALSINAAEVVLPNTQRRTLTTQFGTSLYQQRFTNETRLVESYPDGVYTADLTLANSTHATQTITLGAAPNTPRCSNWQLAQAIDATKEFTLAWDAFTAVTDKDFIEIRITDATGKLILQLPDLCSNPTKPLAATATSVVLPANLLSPASAYPVELSFYRVSEAKTNAAPAFSAFGAYYKATHFQIKTIGGGGTPNDPPVINAFRIANDGRFEVDVSGSIGRTVTLEATTPPGTWTAVGTGTVGANGKTSIRDSRPANLPVQIYRVKSE